MMKCSFALYTIVSLYAFQAEAVAPTHYYEVDFPEVTKKKAAIVANREVLHKLLGSRLDPQSIGALPSICLACCACVPTDPLSQACFVAHVTTY